MGIRMAGKAECVLKLLFPVSFVAVGTARYLKVCAVAVPAALVPVRTVGYKEYAFCLCLRGFMCPVTVQAACINGYIKMSKILPVTLCTVNSKGRSVGVEPGTCYFSQGTDLYLCQSSILCGLAAFAGMTIYAVEFMICDHRTFLRREI